MGEVLVSLFAVETLDVKELSDGRRVDRGRVHGHQATPDGGARRDPLKHAGRRPAPRGHGLRRRRPRSARRRRRLADDAADRPLAARVDERGRHLAHHLLRGLRRRPTGLRDTGRALGPQADRTHRVPRLRGGVGGLRPGAEPLRPAGHAGGAGRGERVHLPAAAGGTGGHRPEGAAEPFGRGLRQLPRRRPVLRAAGRRPGGRLVLAAGLRRRRRRRGRARPLPAPASPGPARRRRRGDH